MTEHNDAAVTELAVGAFRSIAHAKVSRRSTSWNRTYDLSFRRCGPSIDRIGPTIDIDRRRCVFGRKSFFPSRRRLCGRSKSVNDEAVKQTAAGARPLDDNCTPTIHIRRLRPECPSVFFYD